MVRIPRHTFHRPDGAVSALAGLLVGLVLFLLALETLWGSETIGSPPIAAALSEDGISELPDFTAVRGIDERKREFFEFLQPIIDEENLRIAGQRERLLELRRGYCANGVLPVPDLIWLQKLAREYELPWFTVQREGDWQELMMRVDLIPTPLALAQAALESAWGTSRLARLSLGLFGEYCYTPALGILPDNHPEGDPRLYRTFESVNASVRSYMRNLNTHPVYRLLWLLRAQQRAAGEPLDSHVLAAGLRYYSELRGEYVQHLRRMLRDNRRHFELLEPLI